MISKDEVNLYDRQIRLWGVTGQTRLRDSRFLVLGFGSGVAVEAVKNLALAGVGSLVLQSDKNIAEDELSTNFFARYEDIGENAAVASSVRVQRLNPRVATSVETRPLKELESSFFASFDVVIASQIHDAATLRRINDATHAAGHAFYAVASHGWAGYVFTDLVEHEFTVRRPAPDVLSLPGRRSATREVIRVDIEPDPEGKSHEVETVKESFVSFSDAISVEALAALKAAPKRTKRLISPYTPALIAAWESDRGPDADIEATASALGLTLPAGFVDEWRSGYGRQVAAVTAVLGGIVAQDAINFLTRRRDPLQNFLVYDGKRGKAPILWLGVLN